MKIGLCLLTLVLLFASGCATLPHRVPGEIVPPGTGPGTWAGIRKSGVSEDVNYVFLISEAYPIGKSNFFPPTVKNITWWAVFQPSVFGFIRTHVPSFVARWYAPNDALYWEETFPGHLGSHFAKTGLPIAGTPAEAYPGFWRVQIYYEGRLIDEKRFAIDSKDRSLVI
jgi:hypothetical protein